jgi:glycosyltransferase involved in cell wall biosynthesis
MTQVLLAHPGTQYSYQLAKQLSRQEALLEFWTGFALAESALIPRYLKDCLPYSLSRRFANRIIDSVPKRKLRTMPLLELRALRKLHNGLPSQEVLHRRNSIFQERIPESSIRNASAVIGFDTSSWILAARAKKNNKPFFLDQSISHPMAKENTLREVARHFPEWEGTIDSRSPELLRCESEEYVLATKIVVASSYTRHTLISHGVEADKILINPYGVDLKRFAPSADRGIGRPIRFLFTGTICARKGIPLLLEAWRRLSLNDAELWLVGPISPEERRLIPALPRLKLFEKIPYEEMPALLRQCDVLVFPSYCEGFGLVLLEALASGLSIITTCATAGPDLIEDGREGSLIPAGDADALCDAIAAYAGSPQQVKEASSAARLCAEQFSWDSYGDRWGQILHQYA